MEVIMNAFEQEAAVVLVQIAATLLLLVISTVVSWIGAMIGKNKKLCNIDSAIWNLRNTAENTVWALQKRIVDGLKADHGKLTDAEKNQLRGDLIRITMEKMADPAIKLLQAAKVDINGYIIDVGDEVLERIEKEYGHPVPGMPEDPHEAVPEPPAGAQ